MMKKTKAARPKRTFIYSRCPECGHLNIHVDVATGRLKAHTIAVGNYNTCKGSFTAASEQREKPLRKDQA